MKKSLLIFLLCFNFIAALAQEITDKSSGVELPEFVITGSDISTLQKAQKIEPDFMSILDEKFFKPDFSPEDLKIRKLSDPIKTQFKLKQASDFFTGKLEAKAGNYTLPGLSFYIGAPFENGLLQLTADAFNQRAYIENSDQYYLSAGANLFYQFENEKPFFNGAKIQFHADYGRKTYKMYAAADPLTKRELNIGSINFRLENLLENNFNYLFNFTDDIHSLQGNVYSENFLKFNLFLKAQLSAVKFGLNSAYQVQLLKTDIVKKSTQDFFSFKPFVGYLFNSNLKATVGLSYFNFRDRDKILPYIFLGLKIAPQISVFLNYAPDIEFLGSGYFLDRNSYFFIQNFVNFSFEKKDAFDVSAKYEYDKYFEITGGIKYFSANSHPYFESSALSGRFNIRNIAAKSYTVYLNSLFHLGPFGYFYGNFELNDTKSTYSKILPYFPILKAFLNYGYNFDFGLNSELILSYRSKQYTDILNTNSINDFIDLSLKFKFLLSQDFNLTFEINNLFNQKNFIWEGYRDIPLAFKGGIIYRW